MPSIDPLTEIDRNLNVTIVTFYQGIPYKDFVTIVTVYQGIPDRRFVTIVTSKTRTVVRKLHCLATRSVNAKRSFWLSGHEPLTTKRR